MNLIQFHQCLTHLFTNGSSLPVPDFHREILEILDSEERKTFIAAPVGFSKSSCLKSWVLYNMFFRREKYQLYISSSSQKGIDHMTTFNFLFTNKQLMKDLSYVLGCALDRKFEAETVKANTEEIIVKIDGRDCKLASKSANQDMAGTSFQNIRPSVIAIDDIEDKSTCNNPRLIAELWEWMTLILFSRLPSLDEGKIRMIGTNLGLGTICDQMLKDKHKDFFVRKFSALDQNNQSIWEGRFPTQSLLKEEAERPYIFAKNYRNEPIDTSQCPIQESMLRFYDSVSLDDFDNIYVHADLTHTSKSQGISRGSKKDPDDFCLVAMGKNKVDKNYYVLDFVLSDEVSPGRQAEYLGFFYSKYKKKIRKITFDEKGYASFGYWAKEYAKQKLDISLPLEPLKFPSDKWTHFEPHIEHFVANRVYFPSNHRDIDKAIQQLLTFPKGVKDDFVDGLSGAMDNFTKSLSHLASWGDSVNKISGQWASMYN